MILIPDFESHQVHSISLPVLPISSGAVEHHFLVDSESVRVLALDLQALHGSVILEPATRLELHLGFQNPTVLRTFESLPHFRVVSVHSLRSRLHFPVFRITENSFEPVHSQPTCRMAVLSCEHESTQILTLTSFCHC